MLRNTVYIQKETDSEERDEKREACLRAQWFNVLRVGNSQVTQKLDIVLAKLERLLGYSTD